MAIGSCLLTTFTPATGHAKWIGYQVFLGIGIGFGAQQPLNVAQTVLDRSDISTGSAVIMFMRYLGSATMLPVAQNVFISRLVSKLTNFPGINTNTVVNGGATDLKSLATGEDLKTLLSDYNSAIVGVLYIVVVTSSLTIFGSVFVEWKSLKSRAAEQAGNIGKNMEAKQAEEAV